MSIPQSHAGVTVDPAELARLHEIEQEARSLLRALRVESAPCAHLAESVVTQHHIDVLTQLVGV